MQRFLIIVPILAAVAAFWWMSNLYEPTADRRLLDGAQLQNAAWVRQALAMAARPDSCDDSGMTCLMWAAINGDSDLVRLLLARGADVSIRCIHGNTALGYAAMYGQSDVAQILLDAGTSVDQPAFKNGTPLQTAAAMSQVQTVRLLIARGADVNARDVSGQTALMFAAERGKAGWPVMQVLIASGADVNARDRSGMSALARALQVDDVEAVRILETANHFAMDVQRYLDDEATTAH